MLIWGGGVDRRSLLRQLLFRQSLLRQLLLRRLPHVLIWGGQLTIAVEVIAVETIAVEVIASCADRGG